MRIDMILLQLLLLAGLSTFQTSQASTIKNDVFEIVSEGYIHRELTSSVQVLVDPESQLSISDIQSPLYREQFQSFTETGNSFGINRKSYWLRVSIQFTDSVKGDYILELASPLLDEVTAYLPQGEGKWQTFTAGDTLPYKARMIDHQHLAYYLDSTTTSPQQIYLYVTGGGSKSVPIHLWSRAGFSQHENSELLFTGITMGALFSLLLFNAFLFLTLRETTYLWYVGYLGFIALFMLNYSGMAYRYLWPDQSEWASAAGLVFLLSSMGFGLLFVSKILNIQQLSSRFLTVLQLSAAMSFLLVLLTQFIDITLLSFIVISMAVYVVTITFYAIIFSLRSGYKPALYVLFAFSSLIPGVIITILRNIGVMESSFLSEHLVSVGFIADAILLSLALAYRIRYTDKKMNMLKETSIKQKAMFSHKLVNAQDNERKYIASELHDGLGQNLIVIKNKIRRYFKNSDKPDEKMGLMLDHLLQDTLDLVRGLSSRLYPHQLERLGLKSALENVIESSFFDANIEVDCEIDEMGEGVESQTQLHLYRICQEAIKNILTHASASQVLIRLSKIEGSLRLKISDNGQGVASSWLDHEDFSSSFGLNSIKERVQLLRGNTVYSTRKEGGFTILVEIPL
ncbi:MAG TPA: hypothetical protein ENI67_03750 [Gammaproteobacteria bacterium]|nr:hypothetical protein [Gammaproteobacteria bacterium]